MTRVLIFLFVISCGNESESNLSSSHSDAICFHLIDGTANSFVSESQFFDLSPEYKEVLNANQAGWRANIYNFSNSLKVQVSAVFFNPEDYDLDKVPVGITDLPLGHGPQLSVDIVAGEYIGELNASHGNIRCISEDGVFKRYLRSFAMDLFRHHYNYLLSQQDLQNRINDVIARRDFRTLALTEAIQNENSLVSAQIDPATFFVNAIRAFINLIADIDIQRLRRFHHSAEYFETETALAREYKRAMKSGRLCSNRHFMERHQNHRACHGQWR